MTTTGTDGTDGTGGADAPGGTGPADARGGTGAAGLVNGLGAADVGDVGAVGDVVDVVDGTGAIDVVNVAPPLVRHDPAVAFAPPDRVPAVRHRHAARAVVVHDGRVLLEHVHIVGDPAQGRWWELPGGGMDPGETTAEAAAREIAEETGYLDVEIGPVMATLRIVYRTHRHVVEQHETIHRAHLRSLRRGTPRPEPAEVDGMLGMAWCRPAEVADGRRLVLPAVAGWARDAVAGLVAPRWLGTLDVTGWSDAAPDPVPRPEADPALALPAAGGAPARLVRDARPWTPAVQRLLARLHAAQVAGVPRPLGVDAHGREAIADGPRAAWWWRWADVEVARARPG